MTYYSHNGNSRVIFRSFFSSSRRIKFVSFNGMGKRNGVFWQMRYLIENFAFLQAPLLLKHYNER
jgi:hypothetical protein